MADPSRANDEYEIAVQRRIDALMTDRPDLLRRFDFDGNGEIDAFEMNAIRHIVSEEVLAEWAGEEDPTLEIPAAKLLNGRFQPISELGRGSQGETLLARDTNNGDLVAIKKLDFSEVDDWKSLELFQREVSALKALNHPSIPAFVDAFEDEGSHQHYLVQEFIPGDTLSAVMAHGETMNEEEVIDILKQMLAILEYLHGCVPIVLHRDIKPSNLIRTPDDRIVLVDFGAVQHKTGRGTTVIGTTGYMPQEQLTGRASPASDLYGLGATLIHVITGAHPADLETHRMHIQWREYSHISPYVTGLIDRLVAPAPEDRWQSSEDVQRALAGILGDLETSLTTSGPSEAMGALILAQPRGSGIKVSYENNYLRVYTEPTFSTWALPVILIFLPFLLFFIHPLFFAVGIVSAPLMFLITRYLMDLQPREARVMRDGTVVIRSQGLLEPTQQSVRSQDIESLECRDTMLGGDVFLVASGTKIYVTRHRSIEEAEWVAKLVKVQRAQNALE